MLLLTNISCIFLWPNQNNLEESQKKKKKKENKYAYVCLK